MNRIFSRCKRALALFLGLVLSSCNNPGPPTPVPALPSLKTIVDSLGHQAVGTYGLPSLAVAVGINGQVLYANAYGYADATLLTPAQAATVYQVGSLTKQFTAAAILKLQEQGKLNVDDPAGVYLPFLGLAPAITIRTLLNHTSGLIDYRTFPAYQQTWAGYGIDQGTVLSAIASMPLQFPPGTQFRYSNSNYFLLGTIIERITGVSYAAYLQATVLGPAGLASTYVDLPPLAISARGYTLNTLGQVVPDFVTARSAAFAAGALSSTVSDLIRWDGVLTLGSLLSQSSYQQMISPPPLAGDSYGFGQFIGTLGNAPFVYHTGEITGFNAFNGFLRNSGVSIALLTNADPFGELQSIAGNILTKACTSAELSGRC